MVGLGREVGTVGGTSARMGGALVVEALRRRRLGAETFRRSRFSESSSTAPSRYFPPTIAVSRPLMRRSGTARVLGSVFDLGRPISWPLAAVEGCEPAAAEAGGVSSSFDGSEMGTSIRPLMLTLRRSRVAR